MLVTDLNTAQLNFAGKRADDQFDGGSYADVTKLESGQSLQQSRIPTIFVSLRSSNDQLSVQRVSRCLSAKATRLNFAMLFICSTI